MHISIHDYKSGNNITYWGR